MKSKLQVLILAAGKGKRMNSALPKVLHPVLYKPMLHHVLDLAKELKPDSITVVVGHGEDLVRDTCEKYKEIDFVVQKQQLGTAHAVQSAEQKLVKKQGRVLILSGDVILLKKASLQAMLSIEADCVLATAKFSDPTGYGRIIRNAMNQVESIVEEADASVKQKSIQETNAGIYLFDIPVLFSSLKKIKNKNKQGEYYLTDVIELLIAEKKKVTAEVFKDDTQVLGINDRKALAVTEKFLQARVNEKHLLNGVALQNPESIFICSSTVIESDVYIESGSVLINSEVKAGTVIEANSRIVDSKISKNCRIKQGSYIEGSEIGDTCVVGPYAHLRPGSVLDAEVKLGNFVEVKKSYFKTGAKASHLSYIGDAEIGKNVNLGCGFITCNFDGSPIKKKTVIEDDVFVGSDSQTVAPVKIGKGSYIASGSTVTENVPKDSLVITRGRQTTKPGYAKKYRK